MKLHTHHQLYLERTARTLSQRLHTHVDAHDVLAIILDVAIADEDVYDPEDPGRPLSPLRREIIQAECSGKSACFGLPDLEKGVRGGYRNES